MPARNSSSGRTPGLFAKLRKIFGNNIATIIFGVLLIYMLLSAFFYLTSSHIESYQVTSGPLSRNETYTGLAIRKESVVKADSSGYVNYYAREGSKINANGAVYGLSSTRIPETETVLSQEDLSRIKNEMASFSKGFTSSKFNKTYSFKYQLEGNILQYSGVTGQSETPTALTSEDLNEDGTLDTSAASVITFGNQAISKAKSDGIVLYAKDGYEGKTVDTVTAKDFDQNSYHEVDLKTKDQVKAGDDIYTIITDERWSLLIPLSGKQAAKLADRTSIRVKFLKDDMTQTGDFSIIEIDGGKYGQIDFNRGLIRYASDRFLEIELVTNTVTGLKIPLTSIVTKDFYVIPSTFATTNGSEEGFMVEDKNEDGESVTTFVAPTIYARIENDSGSSDETTYTYYVDKSVFDEGDAIVKSDTQGKYIVGETASLEGVYCINQGYAVFRRIQILDQNEEYAIISKGTSYGLSQYDHIVRDAKEVKEEDILY